MGPLGDSLKAIQYYGWGGMWLLQITWSMRRSESLEESLIRQKGDWNVSQAHFRSVKNYLHLLIALALLPTCLRNAGQNQSWGSGSQRTGGSAEDHFTSPGGNSKSGLKFHILNSNFWINVSLSFWGSVDFLRNTVITQSKIQADQGKKFPNKEGMVE